MVVEIPGGTISSVWSDSFKDKKTGADVEYYRAMVTVGGEAPMQLAVEREDFEQLQSLIGKSGVVLVNIDATPGKRARVSLFGLA